MHEDQLLLLIFFVVCTLLWFWEYTLIAIAGILGLSIIFIPVASILLLNDGYGFRPRNEMTCEILAGKKTCFTEFKILVEPEKYTKGRK